MSNSFDPRSSLKKDWLAKYLFFRKIEMLTPQSCSRTYGFTFCRKKIKRLQVLKKFTNFLLNFKSLWKMLTRFSLHLNLNFFSIKKYVKLNIKYINTLMVDEPSISILLTHFTSKKIFSPSLSSNNFKFPFIFRVFLR